MRHVSCDAVYYTVQNDVQGCTLLASRIREHVYNSQPLNFTVCQLAIRIPCCFEFPFTAIIVKMADSSSEPAIKI